MSVPPPAAITSLQERLDRLQGQRTAMSTLPLVSIRPAAGRFDDGQLARTTETIRVVGSRSFEARKGTFEFVARVEGPSMEPGIPDGAYCVFRRPAAPRDGAIVLVQRHDTTDGDRGGRFVVKRYRSGPPVSLASDNPAYETLAVGPDDAVIASFVEVVTPADEDLA